mgnify:CR=1 FL=1
MRNRDERSDTKRVSSANRRRFLLASAGAGSLFLAGCSGDGGDGSSDGGDGSSDGGDGSSDGGSDTTTASGGPSGRVTMLTSPPGTAGNAMGNAMMSLLTQKTDLEGSASAGNGSIQNVVQVMRGEANISRGVTTLLESAFNHEKPVDVETEYQPLQLFSHQVLRLPIVVRTGSDYQYYSDLSGVKVARGPQPASFQPTLDSAFNAIIEDHQAAYQAPNQMAPALAAGNVGASIIMDANGAMPSFAQEIAARNDLRMLGVKEENQTTLKESGDVTTSVFSNDNWGDAVDEFVMEGETFMPVVHYSMISSAATSADVVYTFCQTMYENRKQLPDMYAGFGPWTETEWYNSIVTPDVPFHPGAAKFLKENDLWKDEFQEADV